MELGCSHWAKTGRLKGRQRWALALGEARGGPRAVNARDERAPAARYQQRQQQQVMAKQGSGDGELGAGMAGSEAGEADVGDGWIRRSPGDGDGTWSGQRERRSSCRSKQRAQPGEADAGGTPASGRRRTGATRKRDLAKPEPLRQGEDGAVELGVASRWKTNETTANDNRS